MTRKSKKSSQFARMDTTMTITLPAALKGALTAYAADKFKTASGVIRDLLSELAGRDKAFAEYLKTARETASDEVAAVMQEIAEQSDAEFEAAVPAAE